MSRRPMFDPPGLAAVPAEREQRIQRLYAWVAIGEDGMEGIMSLSVLHNFMPMIASERRNATALKHEAERVAELSASKGHPVRIELRVFDLAGRLNPVEP